MLFLTVDRVIYKLNEHTTCIEKMFFKGGT